METPLGFNLDFFHLNVSSTGTSTVQSLSMALKTPTVPEPNTIAMMALGLVGLGWTASRRQRA